MKILVAEDEPRIAQNIKRGLELKAHVVDLAADGEAAFELAESEEYDLIILDVMMPKMSGVEVSQALRSEGIQTPILMLTAKTQVGDRVTGLDSGADDYLGKPFAFEELLARVRALGRRPRKQEADVLKVRDLELDTTSAQVRRNGQLLSLSKKEFALLEFLMRHVGQVLTKDQLAQRVWEYESEVLPNTAQVYIGYLRKKVDEAFPDQPPLIKTIRGFGYTLNGEQT